MILRDGAVAKKSCLMRHRMRVSDKSTRVGVRVRDSLYTWLVGHTLGVCHAFIVHLASWPCAFVRVSHVVCVSVCT